MQYVKLPQSNIHQSRSKRILKKFKPILFFVSFLILIGFVISLFKGPAQVIQYAFPASGLKSSEDKINVLLLGNAGGKYAGAYLTDTVMVGSYNPETKSAYFIALPRDLWIDQYKLKLNAVYETKIASDEGLKFTKEVVSQVLGIPIHYGVRIDFSGFERAIDEVGGVEIDVEKTFDDYLYPIAGKEEDLCGWVEEEREFNEEEARNLNIEPGKMKIMVKDGTIATDSADPVKGYDYFTCRFEHIHYNKGLTQMDGKTALKYVRSRMGSNGEGNDFARSRRQQKVIEAFRKKVLSLETLVNPKKISALISTFGQSIETDIPLDDVIRMYRLSKQIEKSSNFVLNSTGTDSLLVNPSPSDYGGAWVLIPKGGNFNEIHSYVQKILAGEIDEASSSAWAGDSKQPKKTN